MLLENHSISFLQNTVTIKIMHRYSQNSRSACKGHSHQRYTSSNCNAVKTFQQIMSPFLSILQVAWHGKHHRKQTSIVSKLLN